MKSTDYAKPVDADDRKVLGHIIATVTRKEIQPIYATTGTGMTYGGLVDGWLKDFYTEENNGAEISDFSIELSSEAQADLRERIRTGSYY